MVFVPQPGDFGLTRGGGLPMLAVRVGTFSRYGHACVCESVNSSPGTDGVPRITIIEPMPEGCRRRAAHPREFVWSDVDLDGEQRAEVVAYSAATLGLPYDWPAIFGFVRRWWAARLTPRHTGPAAWMRVYAGAGEPTPAKLICSALPVLAYRRVGVDMAPGRPAGSVSPGDLRQWLDDQRRALRR